MLYEEKIIETIPVGPLGLIPLKGCEELVGKVDKYLVDWRNERESEHKTSIAFSGYQRDSYIIGAAGPCPAGPSAGKRVCGAGQPTDRRAGDLAGHVPGITTRV